MAYEEIYEEGLRDGKLDVCDTIYRWVVDNHEHHGSMSAEENADSYCMYGDKPYVNSIELVALLKSLRDKAQAQKDPNSST